jgi:Holliday junction DNA helicase RuvB
MDYAQMNGGAITDDVVKKACEMLAIDDNGLNPIDRMYLKVLVEKFEGGPVGIKTLSAALDEDEATLEEVIEPYLLRKGYIEKTALTPEV